MGSKKYKGKPCVYCVDGISIDGEHIISRKFFPEKFRDNLPKAPSCKQCNVAKSKLEHYLTAVLPFSSDHITALQSQAEKVNRRLNKNLPLKNELRSGISPAWFPSKNGTIEKTIAIPFQFENLIEYCKYLVKGFIWYEWDEALGEQLIVDKEKYKHYPGIQFLVCFIYDPDGFISNPKGLIHDLNSMSDDTIKVSTVINPFL